jgi:hypothetical protein
MARWKARAKDQAPHGNAGEAEALSPNEAANGALTRRFLLSADMSLVLRGAA